MNAAHWERIAHLLAEKGVAAKVDFNGDSRSILIRTDDRLIGIEDRWWRKNTAIWIGWQVHVEDRRSSIVQHAWPITKKRSQVVADVLDAIASQPTAA